MQQKLDRRSLLAGGAALMATVAMPMVARAGQRPEGTAFRNLSSFQTVDWRDHFDHLRRGAILADLQSRALHYWSEDGQTHLLYPCSVPMSDEFARRGHTEVVLKRRNPVWIPTPNMRARDPSLPERVEAGPENPMGTRAMNLGWQYYRIHGIDNTDKIGRQASNGCVGLFNHHVEHLFELVEVGTQVKMI
ncbi:L,D-transpeptidase [Plastorhodobacter daqingensis]|uniref:L,D-transpeptidase n=1 Tax=Plastorhodobacter daqingensis TaxID=1387281 RepID=A0ABW2UI20_9RHOB